jgi:hypothetical protein
MNKSGEVFHMGNQEMNICLQIDLSFSMLVMMVVQVDMFKKGTSSLIYDVFLVQVQCKFVLNYASQVEPLYLPESLLINLAAYLQPNLHYTRSEMTLNYPGDKELASLL